MDFGKTCPEASAQYPLPSVCLSCQGDIFDFFPATSDKILTKLDAMQIPQVVYQVCVCVFSDRSIHNVKEKYGIRKYI